MRIKTKFLCLSASYILCVIVLAGAAYSSINVVDDLIDQLDISHKSVLSQSESDRLHDAISGDIAHALSAHALSNKEEIQSAINDFKEHVGDYIKAIDSALGLNLPSDIHQNFVEMRGLRDDFIKKSSLVIDNLDKSEVKDYFVQFNASFDNMDVINDKLTEQVRGLAKDISDKGHFIRDRSIKRFSVVAIIAILIALAIPGIILVAFFAPQDRIIKVMHQILEGHNKEEVPFLDRGDEVGNIAKALEKFRHSNIEKEDLELKGKQAEEDRRNKLALFASNFENSVKAIVDIVASAATEVDITAKGLKESSINAQKETKQLLSNSEQTNENVQGVSKATNEFTNAVNEISSQVANSREYAHRAAKQTDNVSGVMSDLSTQAAAINGIIDIINDITSQINLLALNATIEAARAGDMGKGFAVVANEVKALATKTSKATEQIATQISEIQSSTSKAVASIVEITESVKTINQNSTSIASAVEEQSVTTSYIAESITQVSSMSGAVGVSAKKVESSSVEAGNSASQMVSAAGDLLKQANMLQSEVDKFLSSLKS
jgi:methyl-accepting chemotaxis protein